MIYVYLCIYATQIIQRQERQIQSLWFGTDIHIPDNLLVPFTGTTFFHGNQFSCDVLILGQSPGISLPKACCCSMYFLCDSYSVLSFFFSVVVIEGGEKRVHWKEGAKRERGSAEQTSSQSFKEEG